jgi:hypothetical protein
VLPNVRKMLCRFEILRFRVFVTCAFHKPFLDVAAVIAKAGQHGTYIAVELTSCAS